MKVSLASAIRILPGKAQPLTQIHSEFLRVGRLAEELGFDRVWLSEHHLAEDLWNPSPLLDLAALAAQTERIRVGVFVMLLALHHPLKVAEDVATLDIISNGRFDLAVGAGPMPIECAAFGVDRAQSFGRTYEALEFIERCFTEESVTHHGEHFQFDDITMTTKPVQARLPIWLAPLGPQSIERAARRGYHLASALHHHQWADYPDMLRRHGHDPAAVEIASGPVLIHMADTREQAFDEAEVPLHWCMEFYRRRGLPIPLAPVGEYRKPGNAHGFGVPVLAGNPDDVMAGLAGYRGTPMTELALQFHHPGVDIAITERSMHMFATHILPELATW